MTVARPGRGTRASSTKRSSRASSCSRSSGGCSGRPQARYEPGKLVGAFTFFYGLFRFLIEFVREPDAQLVGFAQSTGLHMGQWLSLPMIILGAWLMWTAKSRRQRVEPIAGTESVA